MGLFDIFKKRTKEEELKDRVRPIFNELYRSMFNEDKAKFESDLESLRSELGKPVMLHLEAYLRAWKYQKKSNGIVPCNDMMNYIAKCNKELPIDDIFILVKRVFINFYLQTSDPNMRTQAAAEEMAISMGYQRTIGCNTDVIPSGIGLFGLDETNPIPVNGIPENEIYLSHLRRADRTTIKWKRVGSLKPSNIWGNVDRYYITDKNGTALGFIYISPYNLRMSTKAPDGFIFV